MFIREIHVDGYGALHNVHFGLEAPVTVVFGPNEAGKSTLLRFIRSMLYGIPSRKDLVERGEPVFGGRHGGRMTVTTGGSRLLTLERYSDGGTGRKTAGSLIVRANDGSELGWTQTEWERHALGGVPERLFRQLFAVSLDELHELRSLQGEEIGNFLYHAGLEGGAALSEVRRKLAAEMDKLYRPRGATQEINRILAAIKESENSLRQSRNGVVLFQETREALLHTERRLTELQKEIPPLAERAAELRGALELREWWLKRLVLLEEEKQLKLRLPYPEQPPLPEETKTVWSELRRSRQQAEERLETAVRAAAEAHSELESLRFDDSLLRHADDLEKLDAMRELVAARREESETVTADLRMLDDTVQTLMSRLSPHWREEDLAAFGSIAAEREPLRRVQQSWAEAERRRDRLEADAGRLQRQRDALLAEMDGSAGLSETESPHTAPGNGKFGAFRVSSRESLLQAWNALEDELRRLERARSEQQAFSAHSSSVLAPSRAVGTRTDKRAGHLAAPRLFAVSGLLGAAAVSLPFVGRYMSENGAFSPFFAAGAVLLAVLAVMTAWFGSRHRAHRPATSAGSATAMEQRVRDVQASVQQKLLELFETPEPAISALLNEEGWKRVREAVQDELARIDIRERQIARIQDLRRRLAELDREKQALEADIREALQHVAELQRDWEQWLRHWKLPGSLTPDSLPELLGMAEQGESAMRRRSRTLERKAALDEMESAFRQSAAALFDVCPPPASLQADTALSVGWLYRKAAEQRSIREEAERAQRVLASAKSATEEAKHALEIVQQQIAVMLGQAEAEDEAGYELRLVVDERRRNLSRERREIELRLEAGRTGQSAAALYELLETHDEAALSSMLNNAEEAHRSAEEERTGLLDRRGRLTQELERLQQEAEAEDRRLHIAELESKMGQLTERYAVLAIADRLLKETKAVFEEERQPEVLRLASRYFAGMSAGAYVRIMAPADSPVILAETEDRRMTDSAFLSRGTQEQLYLAMRFALAEAASPDIPLPLLLDDLFVHFDERRLRRTVTVLGGISQTRQVILFTCHRHVADAIQERLPSARVITWAAAEA